MAREDDPWQRPCSSPGIGTTKVREEAAMTRVDVASPAGAPIRGLARFAYMFVREQIGCVAALTRLIRGGYRGSYVNEEERW